MHKFQTYNTPLTPQEFYILLAVYRRASYGYAIAAQVAEYSDNAVIMSNSTLYSALRRLEKSKLIAHFYHANENHPAPGKERRFYLATGYGRMRFDLERQRLVRAVNLSRSELLNPALVRVQ